MKQSIVSHDAPRAIGPYSSALRTGSLLFVSGQVPFDPATGATMWQLCLTGGPVLAAVVSVPGLVLAGSGHELVGATSRSGQVVYRFTDSDHGAAFLAPVWVTRGVVYAATSGGYLYALD